MKLADLLTEPDNVTLCPVRTGLAATFLLYHAGGAYAIVAQHIPLDIASLGQYVTHMLTLCGGGGLGFGLKSALKGDSK